MSESEYSADHIVVLTGLEAVRRRPGMYFGGVGSPALHHLLWEVVGNAVDEHLAGRATRIRVQIDGHRISVEDDGGGIPVDRVVRAGGLTALEVVMTQLHAGTFKRPHVHVAPGLHGLGLAPVNAVCERLDVEVWRDGRAYVARFARGRQLGPVEELGPTTRHGTRITFEPDFSIFDRVAWDRARISVRLRELSACNPELTIVLDHDVFRSPDGLSDLVRHLAGDPWAEPIRLLENHADEIEVDAALLWTDRPGSLVHGFVGQAPGRGVHVEALRWGIVHAFRQLDERLARVNAPALFEVLCPGLVAAVHVDLDAPRFGDPSRDRLDNPEVGATVLETVTTGMSNALATDHALRDRLLSRIPR